jgi:hypothetical protein
MLILWIEFRNPVFPLFNQIFQSPYYEPEAILDTQFLPRDFWQAVAYPFYWAKTNRYLVSEFSFRDARGAIAYVAIAVALLTLAVSRLSNRHRGDVFAETQDLGIVFIFVTVSFFVWEFTFGNYRYGVPLEMLSGVVTMGALIWLVRDHRLRSLVALVLMGIVATTTIHLDWGRRPFGDRYIDVRVPPLPKNSVVLVDTWDPAAYFIPFAEPAVQYLGIENNFLRLYQDNKFVSEIKRLMRTPGRPKFVLSVGEFNSAELNRKLKPFGLKLSSSPCQPIGSNLEVHALSLCSAVPE